MALHSHQCPECKSVWSHARDELKSHDAFDLGHTCPQCGKVDCTLKYYGPGSVEENAEWHAQQARCMDRILALRAFFKLLEEATRADMDTDLQQTR